MRSKIYSAGAIAITLLAITIKSIAQQPAVNSTPKVSVKTVVDTKTTVEVCPLIKIKPAKAVKVSVSPKVNVETNINELKAEPVIIIVPATHGAMATPAGLQELTAKSMARLEERAATRATHRIIIRESHKLKMDPDSPLSETPPVAFGFREPSLQDYQTPDTQENNSATIQLKDYSKTYGIDANDKLVIDNSFGDVTVHTWNRSEFKIDVHIRVTANEGDVLISDTKINSMVSFKTKITARNGRSLFAGTRTNNNIMVNYTVYMPAKNALEITNRFGTITLPDMDGRVMINSEHGALIAKSLSSTGNIINVSYGSANIESLKESDLNTEYGSLILLSADKLNANISYSSAKIGRIVYLGNINTKYGSGLSIGDVSKNLKSLTINSDYTNVKLGVNNSQNANFDVTIRNGNFAYDKNANIFVAQKDSNENKTKWSPTQNFKGWVGKGNPNKTIFINSSYSTVKLD